jgi:hypothetical protein
MADKVLYFPYIRVPENEWFTRVLLYWDEVGSIVPSEYIYHPKTLGTYMRELVQAELVKQVLPGDHIYGISRFTGAFLELIDQNQVIAGRRCVSLERGETFRIHIEKFGDELAYQLCYRGLAQQSEYPWYEVEKITANLFMAYLASVLGKLEDLQMDPITDHIESLSVFSKSPENILNSATLVDQLRMVVVGGILPGPAGGVAVEKLARFKSRYINQLRGLRRRIESSLLDISFISDIETRNEKLHLLKGELDEEISELRAKMHEQQWPRIVFGTLCGLLAAAIPGARAVATGDITQALEALPGLVTAIYSAFSGTTNQREILRSPLAYAALAQERLT